MEPVKSTSRASGTSGTLRPLDVAASPAATGCWLVPFPAPTLPLNPNADASISKVQKTQLEDVEFAQVVDLAAEPFSKPQTGLAEKLDDTVINDNLETGDGDDLEPPHHFLDASENLGLKQRQAAEPALKKPAAAEETAAEASGELAEPRGRASISIEDRSRLLGEQDASQDAQFENKFWPP